MMFTCWVKACAPPPVGKGGSAGTAARRMAEIVVADMRQREGRRGGGPITKTMKSVASATGMKMVGLKFRIKDEKSATRKIYDKARKAIGKKIFGDTKQTKAAEEKYVVEDLSDILRFTMTSPAKTHARDVRRAVGELKAQGYKILEADNRWKRSEDLTREDVYQGVNMTVQAPDGTRFELQFHTTGRTGSHHVKQNVMHDDYNISRDAASTQEQVYAAETRMLGAAKKIEVPDGIVGAKLD